MQNNSIFFILLSQIGFYPVLSSYPASRAGGKITFLPAWECSQIPGQTAVYAYQRCRDSELTDDERRRLAQCGRTMNQYLLSITENTWSPSTVMGWYSKLIADKYDRTGPDQKNRGRKPITDDLKALILRLTEQNPSWGYKRIRDYAVYLGYEVSFMTVKRIMNKYGYFPPTDGRKLEVCRIYKFFAGNAAANGSNARIYMVHECQ